MNDAANWTELVLSEVQRLLTARTARASATYRIQFEKKFPFRDATQQVPYLHELGITHLYASPYLKARSGSPHGYDICDHSELNPELGTPEDYSALVQALHTHEMGQILDVVPNHMAIATNDNAWWNDVLENGPSSPYADYFDIQWQPVKAELKNKVLMPFLGKQYGDVLESGELRIAYREGRFVLTYYDRVLPLDPRTTIPILTLRLETLIEQLGESSEDLLEYQSIVTALEHLPARTELAPEKVAERQREKEVVKQRLRRLTEQSPEIASFIGENVEIFNGRPGEPETFDLLDSLLADQAYRLSHWKAASDEVNYRRFFDINELAALRMEDPHAFDDAHRLVLDLLAKGDVNGLRIDHIDGLYDPAEYLWRLQWSYLKRLGRQVYERLSGTPSTSEAVSPAAARGRARADDGTDVALHEPEAATDVAEPPPWDELESEFIETICTQLGIPSPSMWQHRSTVSTDVHLDLPAPAAADSGLAVRWRLPLYVVVEKILGPEEPLPREWPVAGTTGYDFLNELNGLYVDPAGLRELEKIYGRFIGEKQAFSEIAYRSKLLILQVAMSSELQMLASRLNRISEQHRRSRDFTLNTLRHALREILACFPIYRTYIGPGGVSDRDRRFVNLAVSQAKRRNPALDAAIFDFIRDTLLLEHPPGTDEQTRHERELFVGRFQQVTSPVTAKGIEDTAFYIYFPLASINEVGGEPKAGTTTPEEFHHENQQRNAYRSGSLLCTTTHDTKRSEDVRARINVLSEVPQMWRAAVNRWARINRRHRQEVDGQPAPGRNGEYLFYQTLVGVWPLEGRADSPEAHQTLIERVQLYMEKATREAKRRTSWINPNAAYDRAVREFVGSVLKDHPNNRFLEEFRSFHHRIVNWGLYNALSQTLLKLTSPGVPDVYQGQELWDFSLVDPDNRRPVDYERRRWLLHEIKAQVAQGDEALRGFASQLCHTPSDQRIKLFITSRTLQFRRRHLDLFRQGEYVPLAAQGSHAHHVCAFMYRWQPPGRQEGTALVVVPRLLATLTPPGSESTASPPPVGHEVWGDTALTVKLAPGRVKNLFTGEEHVLDGSPLPLSKVLAEFPVALLSTEQ